MTVYVDMLMNQGMVIRGRAIQSCHMFTDQPDLTELHALAERIGMQRRWLHHPPNGLPHYDLVPSIRLEAIKYGAIAINERKVFAGIYRSAVAHWRKV